MSLYGPNHTCERCLRGLRVAAPPYLCDRCLEAERQAEAAKDARC